MKEKKMIKHVSFICMQHHLLGNPGSTGLFATQLNKTPSYLSKRAMIRRDRGRGSFTQWMGEAKVPSSGGWVDGWIGWFMHCFPPSPSSRHPSSATFWGQKRDSAWMRVHPSLGLLRPGDWLRLDWGSYWDLHTSRGFVIVTFFILSCFPKKRNLDF